MNTKRCILSTIAVFVFVFLFEFLFHGKLLMGLYEQTSQLWRSHEESKMIFMFLSQFFFAVMITYLYTQKHEGKGVGEGVRFGIIIGLLLATIDLGTYCYMPIPFILTLSWMGASIIKGVGSGIVLSLTYKN